MDALHHDCVEILSRLSTALDLEFRDGYDSLLNKVERIFRTEEQWMEEINFSELKHHREQHASILGSLYQGQAKIMTGNVQAGRDIIEKLLPEWLLFHATTMDTALANEMQMAAQAS